VSKGRDPDLEFMLLLAVEDVLFGCLVDVLSAVQLIYSFNAPPGLHNTVPDGRVAILSQIAASLFGT
jgi:hypothetical protein